MTNVESWILCYLLNSLWQVPFLFLAGWLVARGLRSSGAAAEHRVWVTTLLLQSVLPACSVMPWERVRGLLAWGFGAMGQREAHVSVMVGAGTVAGVLRLPGTLLGAIAALYVCVCAYFFASFIWRSYALTALRREAVEVELTGASALCWKQCSRWFAVDHAVVAASSEVFSPVTIGLRRKLVLLPASMVGSPAERDLPTVIAHEFAHIQRNDFAKNLLYELLSLPLKYHPFCWVTRAQIMETREVVCDERAAQLTGRDEYVRSLLRLAAVLVQGGGARVAHAVGIFHVNTFERRIMKLAEKSEELHGMRRIAAIVACVALGLATCGSALALSLHVDAASPVSDSRAERPASLTVPASVMAGNSLVKVPPHYPDAAKKARIQGTVVLNAVIGKDGWIEDLQVESGPEELRSSSLDAVRQWTYKPYLLNGEPIEVKTKVNVTYSLQR